MAAPELIQDIPAQVVNESASFGPFDLKDYIQGAKEGEPLRFSAWLDDESPLPKGLICMEDGELTGIPAKGTHGNYNTVIHAENADGELDVEMILVIKPSLTKAEAGYFEELKSQVWQAVDQNLPIPDLNELYGRSISVTEVYYLLERWGLLTVWDAFNLEPPGEKVLLELEGVSPHYHVYDRGSCIVATPKDLFSHERTLVDGLETAKAIAREVYERDWSVQLVGFEKLVRAAWVEVQHLGDKFGKQLEVIGFTPTPDDVKVYATQTLGKGFE